MPPRCPGLKALVPVSDVVSASYLTSLTSVFSTENRITEFQVVSPVPSSLSHRHSLRACSSLNSPGMILPQGFALAVPSTWMALSPEISPVYLLTSFKPLPKDTSQGFPYSKLQPSPFHSPHNSETYFSVSWLHLSYHHLFYLLFVFLSLYAPLRQNFLGLCFFFF